MKRKELQELRQKDKAQLLKLVREKKKELVKEAADIGLGRAKNVKAVRNLRRDIAQLMTILREKEIIENE